MSFFKLIQGPFVRKNKHDNETNTSEVQRVEFQSRAREKAASPREQIMGQCPCTANRPPAAKNHEPETQPVPWNCFLFSLFLSLACLLACFFSLSLYLSLSLSLSLSFSLPPPLSLPPHTYTSRSYTSVCVYIYIYVYVYVYKTT